jgi:prolyl-tRNA editing enzyme YbaK/EbsC (Cys-tRNA(Pro) deacylase)
LWDTIFINGGPRGLQIEISDDEAMRILDARPADIAA